MPESTHRSHLDSPERHDELETKVPPHRKAPDGSMFEDDFGSILEKLRGTVSKDLDLEF
jgi:hypothetical protein